MIKILEGIRDAVRSDESAWLRDKIIQRYADLITNCTLNKRYESLSHTAEYVISDVGDEEYGRAAYFALTEAIKEGRDEAIPILCAGDFDRRFTDWRWTALTLAAEHGRIRTVKMLIDRGANVNVASRAGWTPLLRAAAFANLNVAKYLLTAGADARATAHQAFDSTFFSEVSLKKETSKDYGLGYYLLDHEQRYEKKKAGREERFQAQMNGILDLLREQYPDVVLEYGITQSAKAPSR